MTKILVTEAVMRTMFNSGDWQFSERRFVRHEPSPRPVNWERALLRFRDLLPVYARNEDNDVVVIHSAEEV